MSGAVRYPSVIEFKEYTTGEGTVPTSETDALVFQSVDYESGSVVSVAGNTQLSLYIDFTKGSLTNCELIVYLSHKGSPGALDWYQESVESESTGVLTITPMKIVMTASTKAVWHNPIGSAYAVKITVKGNGTVTGSSLKLKGALRVN